MTVTTADTNQGTGLYSTVLYCPYTSKKLPILDMAIWTTGSKILHQHYTKPMASKSVIMARSAFTDTEKKNILVEEGNRRLRNCHPDLPW